MKEGQGGSKTEKKLAEFCRLDTLIDFEAGTGEHQQLIPLWSFDYSYYFIDIIQSYLPM